MMEFVLSVDVATNLSPMGVHLSPTGSKDRTTGELRCVESSIYTGESMSSVKDGGLSNPDRICFLTILRPFKYYDRLGKFFKNDDMFYSLGVCSIISIGEQLNVEEVESLVGADLRAWEIWTYIDGAYSVEYGYTNQSIEDVSKYASEVPSIEKLNNNVLANYLKEVIEEIESSVNLAWRSASEINPNIHAVIISILDNVNHYLKKASSSVNIGLLECRSRLTQLASSISYIRSQALSGSPPLLTGELFFGRHSLLGIGLAWQAIESVERESSKLFSQNPVERLISGEYALGSVSSEQGLLNALDYGNDCSSSNLQNAIRRNVVHKRLEPLGQTKEFRHLLYFSGRMGFRRNDFTLTVPVETLTNCSRANWSLMTLTHELLHAHVDGIITLILSTGKSVSHEIDVYLRNKNGLPSDGIKIADVLRYRIFESSCLLASVERDCRDYIRPTSEATVKQCMRYSEKMLNEIIVHVLDINYFHKGCEREYVKTLWSSWSEIPYVYLDIRPYLLRTLISIGSVFDADEEEGVRWSVALRKVKSCLSELSELNEGVGLLAKQAILMLDNETSSGGGYLHRGFSYSLSLVDSVIEFLVKDTISGDLIDIAEGDPVQYPDNGDVEGDFDFSALGFMRDYCVKYFIEGEERELDSCISAWMLAALASTTKSNEEVSDVS